MCVRERENGEREAGRQVRGAADAGTDGGGGAEGD